MGASSTRGAENPSPRAPPTLSLSVPSTRPAERSGRALLPRRVSGSASPASRPPGELCEALGGGDSTVWRLQTRRAGLLGHTGAITVSGGGCILASRSVPTEDAVSAVDPLPPGLAITSADSDLITSRLEAPGDRGGGTGVSPSSWASRPPTLVEAEARAGDTAPPLPSPTTSSSLATSLLPRSDLRPAPRGSRDSWHEDDRRELSSASDAGPWTRPSFELVGDGSEPATRPSPGDTSPISTLAARGRSKLASEVPGRDRSVVAPAASPLPPSLLSPSPFPAT